MRAWFIALIIVMALYVLPVKAASAHAADEKLQCTWPSLSLLSTNDAGTSAGSVNSFIAGTTVYLQSAGRYVTCMSIKINQTLLAFEAPIFRFVYRLTAPRPPSPPQQQQQPASP